MRDFDLQADQDTFILMDELGSGTEPIIGGALAESFWILSTIKRCMASSIRIIPI